MAKSNQTVESQSDKKNQAKTEPAAVAEVENLPVSTNDLPERLFGAAGDGRIETQASRLGDSRLQSAQRQALAFHIGQRQGNRHLQRAVTALRHTTPIEPYQPNRDHREAKSIDSAPQPLTLPVQRRETPPETDEATPSDEEKAAALAKAAAAEQQAAQTGVEGREQVAKSKTEQAAQQHAGQTALQDATSAKTASATPEAAKPASQEQPKDIPQIEAGSKAGGVEITSAAAPASVNGASPQAGSPDSATEKAPASPETDPAFQATVETIKGVSGQERSHAPAKSKAGEAQAAAVPPATEVESKAQANQVGEMERAETPPFDAAGFKVKLMERITALVPKTAEEADNFKKNDKVGGLKGELQGKVKEEQTTSQAPLAEKTAAAPATGGIEPKPVTPLPPAEAGPEPPAVGAERAAPKPKSQAEVEAPLRENSKNLDEQMAEAEVTEDQLANSNEPEFQTALKSKQAAQTDAQTAPQAYRQAEQDQLGQAQVEAAATAQDKTQAMHGSKAQLLRQVEGQQGEAKGKDEQARAKVAADIQNIYAGSKTKVEGILKALDDKVAKAFDEGAAAAKKSFEDYVEAKMDAYKERRYGGWFGWARWLKDKVAGMPPEVNAFFEEGRRLYLAKMDAVIDNVVAIIGASLTEAKAEIARGKQKIQEYVTKLPENLQQVGQEAAQDIQGKFDQLEQDVNNKQDELINTLAQKYQDNLKAVDARIEEMKAANSGLINKALNAIGGVIKTILQLKDMLLNVLARAADAIGKIIKDPIGFLGNLISGVKQGLQNFVANIGTHLQKGLMTWLFGAVAEAGIQLPESFDLKGILSLVMQVLGLTWENIRARAVTLLGENVVAALEKSFEIFMLIKEQGLGALWDYIQGMLGDLQTMVLDGIKDMVITQVIQAGIQWLMGILGGPAGAFIKAAKAIYDIVMWFVNNGSRVMALVSAVLDSITAIASGNIAGAAKFIEESLAKAIPVVIGFLASLLGLGNISDKIRGIIEKVKAPINKAIDWVIGKAKAAAKKIGGLLGFGKEEEHKKEEKRGDTEQVVTEGFSMSGASHTLTASIKDQNVIVEMSSPKSGSFLNKLSQQIKMEQALAVRTSGEDQQKHQGAAQDLIAIETWYNTQVDTIGRGRATDEEKEKQLKGLIKQLGQRLIIVGNKYGIKELALLEINNLLDEMSTVVKDLRKHVGDPKATGDGHSNSAAAAEVLGWQHSTGQRHYDRLVESHDKLNRILTGLDNFEKTYGVAVSKSEIYQDGLKEFEDCKKAMGSPKKYLEDKGIYGEFFHDPSQIVGTPDHRNLSKRWR